MMATRTTEAATGRRPGWEMPGTLPFFKETHSFQEQDRALKTLFLSDSYPENDVVTLSSM